MKKLLLIVTMLVFGQKGFAQVKTRVFELNLGEPNSTSLKINKKDTGGLKAKDAKSLVLPTQQLLAFKLFNGNPFKYEYSINHKTISFYDNEGHNFLRGVEEEIKPKTSEDLTSENQSIENKAKINSLETQKTLIENEIKNSGKSLSNKEFPGVLASVAFQKKINELQAIKIEMERLRLIEEKKYEAKSAYATNFINEIILKRDKNAIKVEKSKTEKEAKKNISKAVILLQAEFHDLHQKLASYIYEIKELDSLPIEEFQKNRKQFRENYISLLRDYVEIGEEAASFADTGDDFKKVKKAIDPTSLKIKEELTKMYQVNPKIYLLPIDVNGQNIDLVEVMVERKEKISASTKPDTYTYNIWLRGGIKIDVSAGLFMTSVSSQQYETSDTTINVVGTDETQKLIYEKDKGKYDFGFGSLINVSLRGGSWVRPTFNFGALFTADQKFQLLTGLGLIFGKKERIVLHGGLAMGSVTSISKGYLANGSKAYNLGSNGAVPTTDKFTFGHYIGFTYNFGKVKAAEQK